MDQGQQRVARIQLVVVFLALLTLVCVAIAPAVLSAKDDDLTATVRGAILSDPRSETMSQTEVDAMVNALVEEARVKGVTAEDIVWWPEEEGLPGSAIEETDTCGRLPVFLCALNEAFGFSSDDLTMPLALFASSMVLLLVLSLMIKTHRSHPAPPPPLF